MTAYILIISAFILLLYRLAVLTLKVKDYEKVLNEDKSKSGKIKISCE